MATENVTIARGDLTGLATEQQNELAIISVRLTRAILNTAGVTHSGISRVVDQQNDNFTVSVVDPSESIATHITASSMVTAYNSYQTYLANEEAANLAEENKVRSYYQNDSVRAMDWDSYVSSVDALSIPAAAKAALKSLEARVRIRGS